MAGFYTEEIRVAGERQGFRAVTLDGRERDMARVDFRSSQRVGRYGVDVAVIDEVAKLTLIVDPAVDVYLVDEIGKMECLSPGFTEAMRGLLESTAPVVATIAQKGGGFVAEVKQRNDAEVFQVTRGNRDELPARVLAWLAAFGSARRKR